MQPAAQEGQPLVQGGQPPVQGGQPPDQGEQPPDQGGQPAAQAPQAPPRNSAVQKVGNIVGALAFKQFNPDVIIEMNEDGD